MPTLEKKMIYLVVFVLHSKQWIELLMDGAFVQHLKELDQRSFHPNCEINLLDMIGFVKRANISHTLAVNLWHVWPGLH